jgi:hypothetical protein
MIGCESEPLSLKSEYTLICKHTFNTLINDACVRFNSCFKTERFSKVETRLIVKREQEIADLLLGKNVLAVLWEKLDFYNVLVGARKYNENRYRRPYSLSCNGFYNRTLTPRPNSRFTF